MMAQVPDGFRIRAIGPGHILLSAARTQARGQETTRIAAARHRRQEIDIFEQAALRQHLHHPQAEGCGADAAARQGNARGVDALRGREAIGLTPGGHVGALVVIDGSDDLVRDRQSLIETKRHIGENVLKILRRHRGRRQFVRCGAAIRHDLHVDRELPQLDLQAGKIGAELVRAIARIQPTIHMRAIPLRGHRAQMHIEQPRHRRRKFDAAGIGFHGIPGLAENLPQTFQRARLAAVLIGQGLSRYPGSQFREETMRGGRIGVQFRRVIRSHALTVLAAVALACVWLYLTIKDGGQELQISGLHIVQP